MNYRFFILLLVFSGVVFCQSVPRSYELGSGNPEKSSASSTLSNTIEDILIDDNGTIWLATSRGLSKTEDDGATWTNYYDTEAFGTEGISKLGYHDGVIWAATWHSEVLFGQTESMGTGLRYSTDDGETWTIIDQPVDASDDSVEIYGSNRIRALPITSTVSNLVYDIEFTENTIWVALFAGGLRKSTDMGETWERVILPPDDLDIIRPNDDLDFDLSPTDGDLGFRGNLNHRVFSIKAVTDYEIYVGSAGGVNKTTDGGITWRKYNHQNEDEPISGNHIVALDYDYSDGTVWAATWKAEGSDEFWGVSSSSNGGSTWETYLPGTRTQDFGVKYLDGGGTHIFAATEDGIYRTSDEGATWIANSLIVDRETNYQMLDNNFRDVEVDELNDESVNIWVASVGDGIARLNEPADGFWEGDWKIFLASSGNEEDTNIEAFAFPNPFSPDEENIRIQYSTGGETQNVTIRIFDFGMNLVRTVIQNVTRSGAVTEQQDIWDGRDEKGNVVPNGVYFYRIDIGSKDPIFGKIMVLM